MGERGRGRLTRRTTTLLSAAAIAVLAVAGTAWVALRPTGTPQPAAAATLTGTDWVLVGLHGTGGTYRARPDRVELRFRHGRVEGDDGCNGFSAAVTVRGHRLVLGDAMWTEVGCPGELPLDNYFAGTVEWSLHGSRLTVTKHGVGTLVYRASRPARPGDLINRTWVLDGVQNPQVGGADPTPASNGAAVAFRPLPGSTLLIDGSGSLTASTRCSFITAHAQVTATTLAVSDRATRPHSCPRPTRDQQATEVLLTATLRRVLTGEIPWSVNGKVLAIGRADGPVLQYHAATPQPAPSG